MNSGFGVSRSGDIPSGQPLPIGIAEWLAEKILAGDLKPNERLKEGELATWFHTSRAPVREALYLLQLEGLIERQPRRGTVVRNYTADDIEEIYEVRLALEMLALDRLQAQWCSDKAMDFVRLLGSMEEAVDQGDVRAYSECNSAFHEMLLEYGGGRIIHGMWHQLTYPLKFLLTSSTQTVEDMRLSFDEHRMVVRFLERQDFRRAKEFLSTNVRHGKARVLQDFRRQSKSGSQAPKNSR